MLSFPSVPVPGNRSLLGRLGRLRHALDAVGERVRDSIARAVSGRGRRRPGCRAGLAPHGPATVEATRATQASGALHGPGGWVRGPGGALCLGRRPA